MKRQHMTNQERIKKDKRKFEHGKTLKIPVIISQNIAHQMKEDLAFIKRAAEFAVKNPNHESLNKMLLSAGEKAAKIYALLER